MKTVIVRIEHVKDEQHPSESCSLYNQLFYGFPIGLMCLSCVTLNFMVMERIDIKEQQTQNYVTCNQEMNEKPRKFAAVVVADIFCILAVRKQERKSSESVRSKCKQS